MIRKLIILMILAGGFSITAMAEDAPVTIAFDRSSARTDLMTGETVPDYTAAQRGSIRFYLSRLDESCEFFEYFHDGVKRAHIGSVSSMKKVQGKFAIWQIWFTSGNQDTPRVHHLAVSFVPLTTGGTPGNRVHVLLNDLALLDWGDNQ